LKRNGFGASALQDSAIALGVGLLAERLPVAGILADAAMSLYQNIESQALAALLPDNFTLFDFESVYAAIDSFEYYVSSDDMCLSYKLSGIKQLVNCSFPPLASFDTLNGAMMVATRCWADAQRDVGTSNLLACTGSDTCYRSSYDFSTVVCASCPDYGNGYSLYGCGPSTRACTCGVQVTQPDSCVSNEECYFSSTMCLLITGLDLMSYGNQPCAQCSKQVQCVIRDSSGVGKCACVFQPQSVQQCYQQPGARVDIVSPNKMCGYLANTDPTQSIATAQWDSLALTQCLYLNFGSVFCVQVYRDGSATPMAVGLNMAALTASFQSRRLLMDGQILPVELFELHNAQSEYALPNTPAMHALLLEDWNSTAEPCSSLVWAYQQAERVGASGRGLGSVGAGLGPLDTMYLHRCAYWRQVGRETIRVYNLSSLQSHDSFLLSMDDFAAALSQKSVLLELLQKPESLLFALGRMPMLKPLYAAALAVRSLSLSLTMAVVEHSRQRVNGTDNISDTFNVSSLGRTWSSEDFQGLQWVPLHDIWRSAWEQVAGQTPWQSNLLSKTEPEPEPSQQPIPHSHKHGRSLLQTSPQAKDLTMAQNWLVGPFTWPPTYYESLRLQECSVGTALVQILHDILQVLVPFYYDSYPRPPAPPRSLLANLPVLTPAPAGDMHPNSVVQDEGWITETYKAVWSLTGVSAAYVRGFFINSGAGTNVFTISTTMLQCNFAAVTFCTEHKKDLVASAILMVILYVIVAYVSGLIGAPIMGTVFVFFSIPLLLWYSYGLAFTCLPMVPTCLLDDVVSFLNETFPRQLTVPAELSVADNCLQNSTYSACFRPCTEPPMLFFGWRDTFAYGLCSLSVDWCRSLGDLIGSRDSLSTSLYSKALVVSTGGDSLLAAMNICLGVTFVNLIPVAILVIVVLTSAAYLLYLPCTVIPRFVVMVAQAVVYTHAQAGARE